MRKNFMSQRIFWDTFFFSWYPCKYFKKELFPLHPPQNNRKVKGHNRVPCVICAEVWHASNGNFLHMYKLCTVRYEYVKPTLHTLLAHFWTRHTVRRGQQKIKLDILATFDRTTKICFMEYYHNTQVFLISLFEFAKNDWKYQKQIFF